LEVSSSKAYDETPSFRRGFGFAPRKNVAGAFLAPCAPMQRFRDGHPSNVKALIELESWTAVAPG